MVMSEGMVVEGILGYNDWRARSRRRLYVDIPHENFGLKGAEISHN